MTDLRAAVEALLLDEGNGLDEYAGNAAHNKTIRRVPALIDAAPPAHAARLRETRAMHQLDVDFDAEVIRCKCGNFAGTTTFTDHVLAALDTPEAER